MKFGVDEETIAKLKTWLGAGSINIFGLPFSGKDTQGARLAELLGAPLIGGGDILRSSNNEEVKAIIDRGNLAPTDAYLQMITPYLSRPEFAGKPIVLSSVGRWQGEETVITQAAADSGHPQKAIIFLDISEDEVWHRREALIHKQDRAEREDDKPEIITTRVSEFKNKTQPVINYYRQLHTLVEIDGRQNPDTITQEIVARLIAL